jgi:hypothetical protein
VTREAVIIDPVIRGHLIDLATDCVLTYSFSLWSDRRNKVFCAFVLVLLGTEYLQLALCLLGFSAYLATLIFYLCPHQSIVCSCEEA